MSWRNNLLGIGRTFYGSCMGFVTGGFAGFVTIGVNYLRGASFINPQACYHAANFTLFAFLSCVESQALGGLTRPFLIGTAAGTTLGGIAGFGYHRYRRRQQQALPDLRFEYLTAPDLESGQSGPSSEVVIQAGNPPLTVSYAFQSEHQRPPPSVGPHTSQTPLLFDQKSPQPGH